MGDAREEISYYDCDLRASGHPPSGAIHRANRFIDQHGSSVSFGKPGSATAWCLTCRKLFQRSESLRIAARDSKGARHFLDAVPLVLRQHETDQACRRLPPKGLPLRCARSYGGLRTSLRTGPSLPDAPIADRFEVTDVSFYLSHDSPIYVTNQKLYTLEAE